MSFIFLFGRKPYLLIIFIICLVITSILVVEDVTNFSQKDWFDPGRKADGVENNLIKQTSDEDVVSSSDVNRKATRPPRFIFGHSTGHSGSKTVHQILSQPGCPWRRFSSFENIVKGQKEWPADPDCSLTKEKLVPFILTHQQNTHHRRQRHATNKTAERLNQLYDNTTTTGEMKLKGVGDLPWWNNTTYIDIGHYHNRGRTIECLAEIFGEEAAFVHIRRNRYKIARSFIGSTFRKYGPTFQTPCIIDIDDGHGRNSSHPGLSVCPRSHENAGPVNLPTPSDAVWDSFEPFQRFLWYADEMEHRWHTLKRGSYSYDNMNFTFSGTRGRPKFYEITWNTGDELTEEIRKVRTLLGCKDSKGPSRIRDKNQHVKKERIECAQDIRNDFEYRKKMKYDTDTLEVLVSGKFPQHVDDAECVETGEELEVAIERYAASSGIKLDKSAWVLPETNNSMAREG